MDGLPDEGNYVQTKNEVNSWAFAPVKSKRVYSDPSNDLTWAKKKLCQV